MSRLGIIRDQTRLVLSAEDGTSEAWYWRQLSSLATATPRTYGAWEYCEALVTGLRREEVFDDRTRSHIIQERQSFRISDDWGPLAIGYQVCEDPNARTALPVWQVLGIESGLPGSTRWQIGRDIPMLAGADRGGGV